MNTIIFPTTTVPEAPASKASASKAPAPKKVKVSDDEVRDWTFYHTDDEIAKACLCPLSKSRAKHKKVNEMMMALGFVNNSTSNGHEAWIKNEDTPKVVPISGCPWILSVSKTKGPYVPNTSLGRLLCLRDSDDKVLLCRKHRKTK